MASPPPNVCLYYADDAYTEPGRVGATPSERGAKGLMGRHVAGKEFLDAYLGHGNANELIALTKNQAGAKSFLQICSSHDSQAPGKRRIRAILEQEFHHRFGGPEPPGSVIHFPNPPDHRYAWARQHLGPGRFSLTGVTHTLSSLNAIEALCQYVVSPVESFDALICTSEAVRRMVRASTGAYSDYLRERHGGTPGLRLRVEMIPLGVDPEKFRPPTHTERAAARRALQIDEEEVAVLFVGRLSFHAKAHPFPMYDGLARAARMTGKKVHLILSGWAANDHIRRAFEQGARVFAPGVKASIVDGTKPENRKAVWQAADLFTSLSDNIQETFGLVITEAMASGLPVVASDWDGYRDQVVSGETGYLVPTSMVRDATADATSRLVMGEVNYDHFLCECNQTVTVHLSSAADAYSRLLSDASLRRAMGEAGRRRAAERFSWSSVIRSYENLWQELDTERRSRASNDAVRSATYAGPSLYPSPESTFASYPTSILDGDDLLVADENARERLSWLMDLPLTNYESGRRSADPEVIRSVLAAAKDPVEIKVLDAVLARAGLDLAPGRATIGWMCKYGLIRPHPPEVIGIDQLAQQS